jgi:hypothetical protein
MGETDKLGEIFIKRQASAEPAHSRAHQGPDPASILQPQRDVNIMVPPLANLFRCYTESSSREPMAKNALRDLASGTPHTVRITSALLAQSEVSSKPLGSERDTRNLLVPRRLSISIEFHRLRFSGLPAYETTLSA